MEIGSDVCSQVMEGVSYQAGEFGLYSVGRGIFFCKGERTFQRLLKYQISKRKSWVKLRHFLINKKKNESIISSLYWEGFLINHNHNF